MNNQLKKEAQIMRQPGQYDMPLRVCPKLPFSVGGRLISTYNCRHYCIDSIVLDDDPDRVYCAEALWRRHVMDKFSQDFKDKDGHLVGGYINERFQVFHDDGGNQMELANGERTRKPRPHQYSTERRLEEARKGEVTDLVASDCKVIKLAKTASDKDDVRISRIFGDMIEMKEAKMSDEDIIYKVAEHYDMSIPSVAQIYKVASQKMRVHAGDLYKMVKTAFAPAAISMIPNAPMKVNVNGQTVEIDEDDTVTLTDPNKMIFQLGDKTFQPDPSLINKNNLLDHFTAVEDLQKSAEEVGLTEPLPVEQGSQKEEFPIQDVTPSNPQEQPPKV